MSYWDSRRVMVTGGGGFLGGAVVRTLEERGARDIFVPCSRDYDLREHGAVVRALREARPDLVIHLAAVVGGIGANRENPGRFFYDNAIMGIQLIEQSRREGVDKFVTVGTVCAYPKFTPVPFREDDMWNGYPEETNAPWPGQEDAARPGSGLSPAVRLQRHSPRTGQPLWTGGQLDPQSSHVIPAMIKKCVDAREKSEPYIDVWGTGSASREFLYVDDAAEGIALAAEHYNGPEPVNLGVGREIAIRELVRLIAELTGFEGEIRWDATKPDGQPRRALDTSRAAEAFAFRARTTFEDGLRRAVDAYLAARVAVR